jgi:hypothetical protein
VRDVRSIAVRTTTYTMCWLVSILLGPALKAQEFPVVFDSPAKLRQLGIAMNFGKQVPPLKNKCYYYGDGGYLISTSDEFYSRFKKRGFSIEAMCLGLISNTHYDPETGRRLPTYILVDRAALKESMRRGGDADAGTVTDELPLDLPECFKNANPYGDCRFQYGRVTGKALTAAETDSYKRLGAAIDKIMKLKLGDAAKTQEFYGDGEGEEIIKGFRRTEGNSVSTEADGAVPEDLLRYSSATIWVRSTELGHGYGYGLDSDGGAGPDVNPAMLKAAAAGLLKPQIDPQRLRQILDSNK